MFSPNLSVEGVPVSVVSRRSAFFRIAAEEPDAAGPWK
jgi:hypothetical protein